MQLWTIQTKEFYDTLMRQGFIYCDRMGYFNECHPWAYQWMSDQMRQRIGNPPLSEIKYPLWAYYQYHSLKDRKPPYKMHDSGEDIEVYMEIDIPRSDVLLSDIDMWACEIFNGGYCGIDKRLDKNVKALEASAGEYLFYQDLPEYLQKKYRRTWQLCLEPFPIMRGYKRRQNRSIQATFWLLKKEQVVSAEQMERKCKNAIKRTRLI